jgi:hypothetical protein
MPNDSQQSVLSRIVAADLVKTARAIAGFRITRGEFASAANISGVRAKTLTFSRRHDSRTVFASNADYGYGRQAGAWSGADRTAAAACRQVLRSAKIPGGEIAAIDIQGEMSRTAERISDTEVRVGEPSLLRKLARARRVVHGIPVWSSYATVGLTARGVVGSVEIHWPEVSETVLAEAGLLQQLVKRGFQPPEVKGGTPESIDAGVVHSPAIGFFMDIAAVIRVVYAVDQPGVGRKPVLYLDRHGESVEMPRSVRLNEPKEIDRPKPKTVR